MGFVAGNHRLGGNIRLAVSPSQGNVPPPGRLCQCGAAVGSGCRCWWRFGTRPERCDQRPCRACDRTGRTGSSGGGYDTRSLLVSCRAVGPRSEHCASLTLFFRAIRYMGPPSIDLQDEPKARALSCWLRPNKNPKSGLEALIGYQHVGQRLGSMYAS